MKKALSVPLLLAVLLSCSVTDKSTLNNSPPQSTEKDVYKEGTITHQEKIKDHTNAIELNPSNPWGYFNRGLAKANSQDHLGAIEDYTIALKASHGIHSLFFLYRGLSYIELQKKDKACGDWAVAGEVGGMKAAFSLMNKHCR